MCWIWTNPKTIGLWDVTVGNDGGGEGDSEIVGMLESSMMDSETHFSDLKIESTS